VLDGSLNIFHYKTVITVFVKTQNQVTLEKFLTNNVTNHAVVITQKLAVAYGEMLFTMPPALT
jgi:guanylate kinase